MEPLGKKLKEARLARNISLEEASRVTKIRPSRIEEIEAEDFSSFPSLAYAKGFLLIYGKFLDVDVTPYLEAFEISDRVTVDGYSYLQSESGGLPPAPIVRRQPVRRPALLPLFLAVGVLVVGLYLMKLFLDIQRINSPAVKQPAPAAAATASVTPTPVTSPPEELVAPRAIPVESPPAAAAIASPTATSEESSPTATEPEVRRAEPVRPVEETPPPQAAATPSIPAGASPNSSASFAVETPAVTPTSVALVALSPSPSAIAAPVALVEITPVRKTFVRVIIDNNSAHPAYEGWLSPSDPPLSFRAQQVRVKALERGAIQVTKNGAPLRTGDAGVDIE